MDLKIDVDTAKAVKALQDLGNKLCRQTSSKAVRAACYIMQKQVRNESSVRTGALRNSWKVRVAPKVRKPYVRMRVQSDLLYAIYLQYGSEYIKARHEALRAEKRCASTCLNTIEAHIKAAVAK